MAKGFTLTKVHDYQVTKGVRRLRGLNPYMRLATRDEPPVFLQGGKAYYENGEEASPLPKFVTEQMGKLDAETLASIGFVERSSSKKVS